MNPSHSHPEWVNADYSLPQTSIDDEGSIRRSPRPGTEDGAGDDGGRRGTGDTVHVVADVGEDDYDCDDCYCELKISNGLGQELRLIP